jgi:hypothetical protein
MEKKKLPTVFIISIVLMVIIMGMVDSLVPNVRLTGLENTCPLLIPIIPELFTGDNPVSLSFAHYSGLDPVHEPLGVGGEKLLVKHVHVFGDAPFFFAVHSFAFVEMRLKHTPGLEC